MAYVEKETDIPEDIVDVTQKLWKSYSQKRDTWAQQAQEDAEFRLGRQWTAEQQRILLCEAPELRNLRTSTFLITLINFFEYFCS